MGGPVVQSTHIMYWYQLLSLQTGGGLLGAEAVMMIVACLLPTHYQLQTINHY